MTKRHHCKFNTGHTSHDNNPQRDALNTTAIKQSKSEPHDNLLTPNSKPARIACPIDRNATHASPDRNAHRY